MQCVNVRPIMQSLLWNGKIQCLFFACIFMKTIFDDYRTWNHRTGHFIKFIRESVDHFLHVGNCYEEINSAVCQY